MSDINVLRESLFDMLKQVKDPEKPMDLDRAKTGCLIADKLIDIAKVEVDFARVNGSVDTQFFTQPQLPAPGQSVIAAAGETNEQPISINGTKTLPNGNKVTTDGAVTTHKSH